MRLVFFYLKTFAVSRRAITSRQRNLNINRVARGDV